MALGFRAVDRALAPLRDASPSQMYAEAAAAFLDAVGASTGPLYATGFRRAAQRLEGRGAFGPEEEVLTLEAIAAGIAARGKAQRGDKTMLDVWLPAAEAARAAFDRGLPIWPPVLDSAARGAEATGAMVASRGRAARLGERSLGHLDPGAVSAAIILRAMAGVLAPAR
jgi:dihydroxyacetone kinase-like protein